MKTTSYRFVSRLELDELCGERLGASKLAGLYVDGDLGGLAAPTVAVVGTRAPSDDGRRHAFTLGEDLGAAGLCVVSGLALGIDSAAHAGALAAGAPTIAILGGGHRRLFPRRNRGLAEAIVAAGGAVVSPYAADVPARPFQFLARNGVVAALADGLVVVEAAARSGALNTASWAADHGIAVMAFPADVDRPKGAGCLALIRDGATLVRHAGDVLAQLGLPPPSSAARTRSAPLRDPGSEAGRYVVARLARGPASYDALAGEPSAPGALLACVGELLAAGIIVEGDDATLRLPG